MILECLFCEHGTLAGLLRHFGKMVQIDLRHDIMLVGCEGDQNGCPDPDFPQAIARGSRFIPSSSRAPLVLKNALFMSRHPREAQQLKPLSTTTSPG